MHSSFVIYSVSQQTRERKGPVEGKSQNNNNTKNMTLGEIRRNNRGSC